MYNYKALCTNVVDGDTIDVVIDLGFHITTKQRLRLSNIDTPERGEENYLAAKIRLKELILNKNISIITHKPSKWGYYLTTLYTDAGEDIGEILMNEGLAKYYLNKIPTLKIL